MKKTSIFFLICIVSISGLVCVPRIYAASKITVYISQEKGEVNKNIFGNNLLGFIGKKMYSDYGTGMWDPDKNIPVPEALRLAREIGSSILRFPGGSDSQDYNWKDFVSHSRHVGLFGLNEFLAICSILHSEAVYTLSTFIGAPSDAVDLLDYLKKVNLNYGNKIIPEQRKDEEKLLIKYFEIGNEDWNGNRRDIKRVEPLTYADKYLAYYSILKQANSKVKIGVILKDDIVWDESVLCKIKNNLDFGILHIYPKPFFSNSEIEHYKPEELFLLTLSLPQADVSRKLRLACNTIKRFADKNVPLAITEFNSGFMGINNPVPLRHSLGSALLVADLINLFLESNDILFANYWNYSNAHTGMISNNFWGKKEDLYNPYFKRPNYLVFQLFAQYFGDILLNVLVDTDTYSVNEYFQRQDLSSVRNDWKVLKELQVPYSWEVISQPGVDVQFNNQDKSIGITFQNPTNFNYFHVFKTLAVEGDSYYLISGYVKTKNLIDNVGVCLEVQDARGWNLIHSASSSLKLSGNNEWTYVEFVYKTRPDAKFIKIFARRAGNEGLLIGSVYYKDIRVNRVSPYIQTEIPYLSATASKSVDGKKIYIMVINKNMHEYIKSDIELKDFIPMHSGKSWVLNGPSIDATNEEKHDNVKIWFREFAIWSTDNAPKNIFQFTFEPHSLTAIEIDQHSNEAAIH